MTIGVDIIGEDKIDSLAAAMKAKGTKGRGDTEDVVKTEEEDVEVTPEWQRDPPVEGEVSNMSSNRLVCRIGMYLYLFYFMIEVCIFICFIP